MRESGVFSDAHPVRDLLRGREIRDERRGDAEVVRDDLGDVDRRVAHALDGRDEVQHARHRVGVAG